MKLSALIEAVNPLETIFRNGAATTDPEIRRICYRSDRADDLSVFVAVRGGTSDGHEYAGDAVRRGAVAVVAERPVDVGAAVILVSDTRRAMAIMADALYGSPSSRLKLIGITGTNGKTTTACLLEHILKDGGFRPGVIGTIDSHFGETVIQGSLTTPEAPDLQERLARMADAGVDHVVLEVSSHGVVQDRIFGCRFDMGIFTNLSRDHLDFHGTMDAYRKAKTDFFTGYMGDSSTMIINCDADEGKRLAAALTRGTVMTVGTDSPGDPAVNAPAFDVRGEKASFDHSGISGRIRFPSGKIDFHSPLVGRFNLENILCAAGAAFALGVDPETIGSALATFAVVPGRLEKVANRSGRQVFVDYSHTPEALENVLVSLRPIVAGRLICIFGCGGDRDNGKRPLMGKIAATLADLAIVTSDNPRTEPPERIISEILEGVRQTKAVEMAAERLGSHFEKGAYTVVPDRSNAIDTGVRVSLAGDAILIAGKGHETYQILGRHTIDFDDRVQAQKALARHGMA